MYNSVNIIFLIYNVNNMIILFFLLTLNFSCIGNETPKQNNTNNSKSNKYSDSLEFSSGIRAIFQDSKGNYWIGSHSEGVCVFDGKKYKYFNSENGLANNHVRSIKEDSKGNIWIGTDGGVSSYNGDKVVNQTNLLYDNYSLNTWSKGSETLWFNAGIKEGVNSVEGQSVKYLPFPFQTSENDFNTYSVTSISEGKNNMIWFGTFAGVFGYDGKEFTIINDKTLNYEDEPDYIHVRSVLEDSKGRLWIGNNGIGVLLRDNYEIINFSEKHGLIHPTSNRNADISKPGTLEHVFVIHEDAEGNIWFSDRDTGVWKYDGSKFTNFEFEEKSPTMLNIWCIYTNSDNALLFGTYDGKILKLDDSEFVPFF